MNLNAIIFDVDGTLADTEDAHRIAFSKAFAQSGLTWNWDVPLYDQLLAVTGGKERIRYYLSDTFAKPANFAAFVQQLHALKTQQYTAMVRGGQIPLRPGIKTLIETAHSAGIALGIAATTAPVNVAVFEGAAAVFEDLSDLPAFCRIAGLPLPKGTTA